MTSPSLKPRNEKYSSTATRGSETWTPGGWRSDGCQFWCSYFIHTPVSHCVRGGQMWFWSTSSILRVIITCQDSSGLSLADASKSLASHWSINDMGVEPRPGQGGFADNVKTAAFFVCDFYKIWWATIYTWITFKTVRASDQALNWLDVKYLCVQSISCM